jgi:hypothetical protein
MGPVGRRELVEALLQLTDPRTCLIWRRGLEAWTPAANVPEIDAMLASVARVEPRSEPAPPPQAPPSTPEVRRRESAPRAPRAVAPARRGSLVPVYAGAAILAVLVGGVVWWLRPRPAAPVTVTQTTILPGATTAAPVPDTAATAAPSATEAPPATEAAPQPAPTSGDTTANPVAPADREADLPPDELRRLRGVGGWAGEKLTITLYNGSSWRVTEIYVLMSRMEGDRFVDSALPQQMLPAGAPVEGAVQNLLQKVAPDRKRAGVNPADTGPFEAIMGPQPTAFRWKIDRARGYPPRPSS